MIATNYQLAGKALQKPILRGKKTWPMTDHVSEVTD